MCVSSILAHSAKLDFTWRVHARFGWAGFHVIGAGPRLLWVRSSLVNAQRAQHPVASLRPESGKTRETRACGNAASLLSFVSRRLVEFLTRTTRQNEYLCECASVVCERVTRRLRFIRYPEYIYTHRGYPEIGALFVVHRGGLFCVAGGSRCTPLGLVNPREFQLERTTSARAPPTAGRRTVA